ncbi:MAG: type II secretion system protein GspG [Planctomycetota bacterium]|jgi:hypothetical protein
MTLTRTEDPPASLAVLERPVGDTGPLCRLESDPWFRPYRIERTRTRGFRICSNGPDGRPGTADDICSGPLRKD